MDIEGQRKISEVLEESSSAMHSSDILVTPEDYRFAAFEVERPAAPGYERVKFITVHTNLPTEFICNALSKARLLASDGRQEETEGPLLKLTTVAGNGHLLFEDVTEPVTI